MSETPVLATRPRTLRERTAEEVRALLARKRISATELARQMGVSQAYVWRRLDGRTAFDLDDLERVALLLGVPILTLLPADLKDPQTIVGLLRPADRMSARKRRPVDNRPAGHPSTDSSTGVRRTARLPRGAVRRAA